MSETKNIKKMKAVRLHTIGDLRCDEMEVPVPKGEELLIRVGACGVCGENSDLHAVHRRVAQHGVYDTGKAASASCRSVSACAARKRPEPHHRRDQKHDGG